ncbi:hypothetical protein ES703_71971 [subsurface metagenome]
MRLVVLFGASQESRIPQIQTLSPKLLCISERVNLSHFPFVFRNAHANASNVFFPNRGVLSNLDKSVQLIRARVLPQALVAHLGVHDKKVFRRSGSGDVKLVEEVLSLYRRSSLTVTHKPPHRFVAGFAELV